MSTFSLMPPTSRFSSPLRLPNAENPRYRRHRPDLADIYADVLGKPVSYSNISAPTYIGERVAAGWPEPAAVFLSQWFAAIACPGAVDGNAAEIPARGRRRRVGASSLTGWPVCMRQ
jgi:hypothetical protein